MKIRREVGRKVLCGRPLYVGHQDEQWNAEELIDMWNLEECREIPAPRTQAEGLKELRILAERELSVCSMGLVLKNIILERPRYLEGSQEGFPVLR